MQQQGVWNDNLSYEDANTLFSRVQAALNIPAETPAGRKRRTGQLSWITIVRIKREEEKRKRRKVSE